LSPERVDGQKAEHRSDIYSLGIIAYYMFSGELPYQGKPMEILMQHREGNAAMVHEVNKRASPEIATLVKDMMAVELDNRPQSMLAVLDQVKILLTKI
jgi:serine/threonine protein kinase